MPKIMQDLIKQYVEAVIKKVPVPGKNGKKWGADNFWT